MTEPHFRPSKSADFQANRVHGIFGTLLASTFRVRQGAGKSKILTWLFYECTYKYSREGVSVLTPEFKVVQNDHEELQVNQIDHEQGRKMIPSFKNSG